MVLHSLSSRPSSLFMGAAQRDTTNVLSRQAPRITISSLQEKNAELTEQLKVQTLGKLLTIILNLRTHR